MIPEGTYRARADRSAVQFGMSARNNEQVSVPFTIVADGPHRGQTITFVGSFAPGQATDITCDALEAAGWDGVDLRALNGLGDVDVDLVIVHETYEGKKRARIRFVNRVGGGFKFAKALEPARVTSLAERVARQRSPNRAPVRPPPDTGEHDGEWNGFGQNPNDEEPPF